LATKSIARQMRGARNSPNTTIITAAVVPACPNFVDVEYAILQ